MHSNPHPHNLRLSHTRLVTVYGHRLWRIDLAAGLKCFYLFGLQRPHERLQWNRCVKRERSACVCVCVCMYVWHVELCPSWCCPSLSLYVCLLFVSRSLPLWASELFSCNCLLLFSIRSVCLTRSLALSLHPAFERVVRAGCLWGAKCNLAC